MPEFLYVAFNQFSQRSSLYFFPHVKASVLPLFLFFCFAASIFWHLLSSPFFTGYLFKWSAESISDSSRVKYSPQTFIIIIIFFLFLFFFLYYLNNLFTPGLAGHVYLLYVFSMLPYVHVL